MDIRSMLFRLKVVTREALCAILCAFGAIMVIILTIFLANPQGYKQVESSIYSSYTNEKIKHQIGVFIIFNRMKLLLPYEVSKKLKLKVLDSKRVNAWSKHDGEVVITTAMLNYLNYDSGAVAAILGHEIAHYSLNHHYMMQMVKTKAKYKGLAPNSVVFELMSDKLGLLLAKSAGYNPCNSHMLWIKFITEGYTPAIATSHPTPVYRAWNIRNLCRRL